MLTALFPALHLPQFTTCDKEVLVKDLGQTITFFDGYILFESKGIWLMENEKLATWEEKQFHNKVVVFKESLRLELYFNNPADKYGIDVNVFRLLFKSEKEANEVFQTLIRWRTN